MKVDLEFIVIKAKYHDLSAARASFCFWERMLEKAARSLGEGKARARTAEACRRSWPMSNGGGSLGVGGEVGGVMGQEKSRHDAKQTKKWTTTPKQKKTPQTQPINNNTVGEV